ncbi:uncharacterized protein LOC128670876 [Plodia interpunctella]|uniref:uncharacterized protein LOC128670876 n=1 Tax=Plodia interpunctella TaxID=58824 RepID=UPI002367B9A1|nr:uncharacterized protein LOC128670876 [Plodia interpunctella]
MFLFLITAEIFIVAVMNLSANCLPSGAFKNSRRQGRGIFGPEPKSLENLDNTSVYSNDTTDNTDKTTDTTGMFTIKTKKKWQVGRVSRKQYEIVNMIWRKTKVFLDTESRSTTTTSSSTTTTTSTWNNDIKTYLTKRSTNKNSETYRNKPTESYIEFYYLDEIDGPRLDQENHSSQLNSEYIRNRPQNSLKKIESLITLSPVLAFHVNISPRTKHAVVPNTASYKTSSAFRDHHIKRLAYPFLYSNNYKHSLLWDTLNYENSTSKIKRRRSQNLEVVDDYKDETCPLSTQSTTESATTTNTPNIVTESYSNEIASTLNDRIKFFEIYDRQTENDLDMFCDVNQNTEQNQNNSLQDEHNVEKLSLEHVDINSGHDKNIPKYLAKKHINKNEYISKEEEKLENKVNVKRLSQTMTFSKTLLPQKTNTKSSSPMIEDYIAQIKLTTSMYPLNTKRSESTEHKSYVDMSKIASWSRYPFAAVYVYEPSQILCDAAAVSQHWLITAGSCLSRQHRREPSLEGRSAFITYCGATWRQPERIAYVKYTLVHPKFNLKDRRRQFLYNIGAIQVVGNMMSACPGWAPITVMGHQFTTHPEGAIGTAVGWGLDRYASKYPESEIPTHPLMEYNDILHSNHCPGNIGYNEAKLVEPLHVMKNVYCLSLPPYNKEESDPVHGSLLLIGGKLLALYLQEERRGWGEQSAQYTGVWRLIPWIVEVAKEPEDIDAFPADI